MYQVLGSISSTTKETHTHNNKNPQRKALKVGSEMKEVLRVAQWMKMAFRDWRPRGLVGRGFSGTGLLGQR